MSSIDLRSDTVHPPLARMRPRNGECPDVGDDVIDVDPTCERLQSSPRKSWQEATLFMPSAR